MNKCYLKEFQHFDGEEFIIVRQSDILAVVE